MRLLFWYSIYLSLYEYLKLGVMFHFLQNDTLGEIPLSIGLLRFS